MRFRWLFVLIFAAVGIAATVEDPAVMRARLEAERVAQLVATGVLPRVRLQEAQETLADVQAEATLRNSLYEKDVTEEQADRLVELTAQRVERRQKLLDERKKLLAQGIIAKSEVTDFETAFAQAQSDHAWAETRARLAHELAEIARNEQAIMKQMEAAASAHNASTRVEHFVGSNRFNLTEFPAIAKAFETRFSHPLPVSAMGETEVHKSLGFDHRNRVDVALQPDLPEGQWLRQYLASHNIPYFAFRSAVALKATGAHIHIGPPSDHLVAQSRSVRPHPITGED